MIVSLLMAAAVANGLRQPETSQGALNTEAAWVQALMRRDRSTLSALLAPGFVDVTWQGEARTREAVIEALPRRPDTTIELSDLDARLYGDAAIVRGLNTVHDASGRLVGRVRFTDVFVYRDGGWRAVAAQESVANGL